MSGADVHKMNQNVIFMSSNAFVVVFVIESFIMTNFTIFYGLQSYSVHYTALFSYFFSLHFEWQLILLHSLLIRLLDVTQFYREWNKTHAISVQIERHKS